MEYRISTLSPVVLKQAAAFIAERNREKAEHIGYCGTDAEEVAASFLHDLTDCPYHESFLIAEWDGEMAGIIGFDLDSKSESAEIWGPFVLQDHPELTLLLWEELKERFPARVKTVKMFPNKENTNGIGLANTAGLARVSEQSVLVCSMPKNCRVDPRIQNLQEKHHIPFEKLHRSAFPNAYYSAEDIIGRQENGGRVFVWEDGGDLLGYIYGESAPEYGEASIEFLAVREDRRGKGIGEGLLLACLGWLFSIPGINAVDLCVDTTNEKALRLYRNAGFEVVHELYFYSGRLSV